MNQRGQNIPSGFKCTKVHLLALVSAFTNELKFYPATAAGWALTACRARDVPHATHATESPRLVTCLNCLTWMRNHPQAYNRLIRLDNARRGLSGTGSPSPPAPEAPSETDSRSSPREGR